MLSKSLSTIRRGSNVVLVMVALQNVDCVALEKTLVDVVIVEAKERTEETIEVTLEEILPFSS